jgi:outer membrane putative beta-barrel porin/alpha-amylase
VTRSVLAVAALALMLPASVVAQENYEIQVYGSETMPVGTTMFELHSNYALEGRRDVEAGTLPTHHALHETLEITHGFTPWFEIGTYLFTSAAPGQSWRVIGSHLRPRVRAPESWHWPVGASLSMEVGYQDREYSTDTWSLELRPIIDKQLGAWYVSFNPTLERGLRGETSAEGFEFAPNAVVNRDVTRKMNVGVEYYGGMGPIRNIAPRDEQEHQLFGVVNLDLGPDWEFNAGYGVGLTAPTEKRMMKLILGRRVGAVR